MIVRTAILLARRFRQNERGVAAVEFALILPLLILLYLGSIEAAALFTVDKRVSSISSTVGDLVAQWDPDDGKLSMGSDGRLTDYIDASTGIMAPYATTGLRVVVSLVQVKSNGTTKVLWSTANSGAAKTIDQAYPDAAIDGSKNMNIIARGGCVIAAEATYSYLPVLGMVFTSPLTLRHTNYFLPRFGSTLPINLSSTSLANNACTNQT